jgi:hypothetical protein
MNYKGDAMKYLLWSMILLFSLSGCQNAQEKRAEHDAQVAQKAKAELLAELKLKEEEKQKKELEQQKNNKLSHMGITTDNGKLIIDTNKAKDFFKQMAIKMQAHAEKFSKDLEKGMIDDQNAGIEMNNTHIEIDLNKTKIFLNTWSKKIEEYTKEFDNITKDLDIKTQKDTNATN